MRETDMREEYVKTNWHESSDPLSQGFLQTVVDALPEALLVVDRSYKVVLANRSARVNACFPDVDAKGVKCFECLHRRRAPCTHDGEPNSVEDDCPVQKVFSSKAPVRVYHKHFDATGREMSVAVDAAPIFDETGEVVLVVETCRNVTERSLSRRLLRIGNRHMKMKPLIEECVSELRQYTGCAKVGIYLLDPQCKSCPGSGHYDDADDDQVEDAHCDNRATCLCAQFLSHEVARELPPTTRRGSLRFDRFSEFLSAVSDAGRDRLDACCLPDCESLVLIPLRFADANLGLLHVSDPRPCALSASMVESLERLSLEIATSIHRVRIEEALRAARDELETRVSERTAELTKSNQALQSEIEERVRLEREVLHAGVSEQQRIGQELHDGLGQELTGLSYLAHNLRLTLQSRGAAETETAAELARGIPLVLGQIQRIVRGLVPLEIGAADLEIALDVLTSNVAKLTGIDCRFDSNCCELIGDDDVAIQIYRVAQEAVTNAVKHARATTIDVALESHGDAIRLEVCDDGVGIEASAEKGAGCGLRSMGYRARAIGGEFDVRRRSGGGTVVLCTFPRTAPDAVARKSTNHES